MYCNLNLLLSQYNELIEVPSFVYLLNTVYACYLQLCNIQLNVLVML